MAAQENKKHKSRQSNHCTMLPKTDTALIINSLGPFCLVCSKGLVGCSSLIKKKNSGVFIRSDR